MGPLDDERLEWLTRIYGPVDAKYRSLEYVRRQFVDNPFGWSAHVFAVAGGEPVGHCGVVPFKARLGGQPVTVGKLEALAVAPEHRGRRGDGGSLATDILRMLYPYAVEAGLPLLFGLAPPPVARIHAWAGCTQVPVDAPAYVHVSDRATFTGPSPTLRRRLVAAVLATGQRAVVETAYAAARLVARSRATPVLGPPEERDAELVVSEAEHDSWTVSGADAWSWYAASGVLRVLEVRGRFGSRALVRVDESAATTVQIVAWRPNRAGLLPGMLLLGACARIARSRSAPTLRFQPWRGSGGDGGLARTCRRLGFVQRPEAGLVLYSHDEALLAARPELTPFFYVTF